MLPSALNENPVQGEFFTSTTNLADRFVRESIQNSLDAAVNLANQPVHVRFAFNRNSKGLPHQQAKCYLYNLDPHLKASHESLDFGTNEYEENNEHSDSTSEKVEYEALEKAKMLLSSDMDSLVVEDFGTTGLEGSIYSNSPIEKDNDFWGFFRSVGISPKSKNEAGSWGLGKWVFSDASLINAVIGVTFRQDEPHPLLMGQAILKPHIIPEEGQDARYPAYGSFAVHSEYDDSTWFPLPVGEANPVAKSEDIAFIERALENFYLQRGNDPGLSVIVPFPKEELTPASIAKAVVIQYFLPIIKRQLVVTIADSDDSVRIIDDKSIDDEVSQIGNSDDKERTSESMMKLINLARWTLKEKDRNQIIMDVPKSGNNIFTATELEDLRTKFNDDTRLEFLLKTKVTKQKSKNQKHDTTFSLYIERDEILAEGQDYYIRGHLHIPDMDHLKKFKARSLVIVEGTSELGHLLRDSEEPAHTKWNPSAERLKNAWVAGPRKVHEVRNSASYILSALTQVSASNFENILADIFPSKIPTKGPTPPSPPQSSSAILASRINNGFKIYSNPSSDNRIKVLKLVNTKWHIAFAYDIERGSKSKALKRFEDSVKYGYPDFSLYIDINIQKQENCEIKILAENELEIEIIDVPFQLEIRGFDNRDVITEIFELTDNSDELTTPVMQEGAQ